MRGRFLNSVAVMENRMARILTDYFCTADPEKRELFFNEVATSHFLSLRNKKGVLMSIIKKDYPRFLEENREALNALDEIAQFRNQLAHSTIDVSESALKRPIEEGIGFIGWKAGKPLTELEFQSWEVKANMIHSCLSTLASILPFKDVANK